MPPLVDIITVARFRAALANWRYTGYVTAKDLALDWMSENLKGLTLKDTARAMHDFVEAGGAIDEVRETRPEWSTYSFHYDFRLPLGGRLVYIETVLQDDDPDDPTIHIVSLHDA
jgi:hypothetical protein